MGDTEVKIYKKVVAVFDKWVQVKPGCRIVYVGVQDGNICIWYTFSKDDPQAGCEYKVVGTGWEFEEDCIVAGSTIDPPFVWHVLERNAR